MISPVGWRMELVGQALASDQVEEAVTENGQVQVVIEKIIKLPKAKEDEDQAV